MSYVFLGVFVRIFNKFEGTACIAKHQKYDETAPEWELDEHYNRHDYVQECWYFQDQKSGAICDKKNEIQLTKQSFVQAFKEQNICMVSQCLRESSK